MERERRRNYRTLGVVILLAVIYGGWLSAQRTITGKPELDGVIGVVLGLFICSQPAANMLDLLFARRSQTSEWSLARWLGLNVAVLFVGWLTITLGAIYLIKRTP